MLKGVLEEGLMTHYIFVVEVMTDAGMDLRIVTSDNMTTWHAAGMLNIASEMVMDSRYSAGMEDED